MSSYRIRTTKTSAHIEGFAPATTGGGQDMGDHVSYSAYSHCSTLTGRAHLMAYATHTVQLRHEDDATVAPGRVRNVQHITEFDSAQDAYDAALRYAQRHGGERICAKCTAAAQAAGARV